MAHDNKTFFLITSQLPLLLTNHNLVQYDQTKHVAVDRHFIKDKLDSGLLCTPYISTSGQLADILTKGLRNPSS